MFCSGALSAVKSILKKAGDDLQTVIGWGGALLTFEQTHPAFMALLGLIPGEPAVAAAISSAIKILTQTKAIAEETDTVKQLQDFMTELSTLDKQAANGKVFKWASLVLAALKADQNLTEKEADTAVQVQVFANSLKAA